MQESVFTNDCNRLTGLKQVRVKLHMSGISGYGSLLVYFRSFLTSSPPLKFIFRVIHAGCLATSTEATGTKCLL